MKTVTAKPVKEAPPLYCNTNRSTDILTLVASFPLLYVTYHVALFKLLIELVGLCMSVVLIVVEGLRHGDPWGRGWGGLGGTG